MENTEIMTVEQTGQLSTNVFSDPEAFQNLFNIGKMFASSSLVPQAYQGKPMDCAIACDMANRICMLSKENHSGAGRLVCQ